MALQHNRFDRQKNEIIENKIPFAQDQLHYNKEKDYYICPMGQHMKNIGTVIKTTSMVLNKPLHDTGQSIARVHKK
jgi:hypothetical protein